MELLNGNRLMGRSILITRVIYCNPLERKGEKTKCNLYGNFTRERAQKFLRNYFDTQEIVVVEVDKTKLFIEVKVDDFLRMGIEKKKKDLIKEK